MLNKWKDIPLWVKIVIIIPLFIFPLAVHFLFIMPAVSSAFEAQWSAGELLSFCGGYLAFLGPTMLSFVALKQNEEFKKSNDEAQDRLERINLQANELNSIRIIIEFHISRYNLIEKLLNEFESNLSAENFMNEYIDVINATPKEIYQKEQIYYKQNEEYEYKWREITRCILPDRPNASNRKEIVNKASELKDYYFSLNGKDFDRISVKGFNDKFLETLSKKHREFQKLKEDYLVKYYADLRQIMYTPMTLEEVRNIFNPPLKEEPNNGKNENGIPESDRSEC